MARLNLTLDQDTSKRLQRHAREGHERTATLARALLREALDRREAAVRARKLAADYAAGRPDALALLRSMEAAQIGLDDEEEV